MSLLSPRILQRLSRSKLLVREAVASTGIGERPSRAKGAGIEFADHRQYQLGDDIRYLDQHVLARLGEHYIRQYTLYQQLPVTILLDASASMRYGQPGKFPFSRELTAALGYAALVGGDRVLVGAFSGSSLNWFTPLHGVRRAQALFAWLEQLRPRGTTDLIHTTRQAMPRLLSRGLLVIVSDWMFPGAQEALKVLRLGRQELVGIQVLAPEEEDSALLGGGEIRMVDSETGHEIEISLDPVMRDRYREHFERWRLSVRSALSDNQGLYLKVRSDDDLEQLLLRDWRMAGLIA